jgi:hypothetical protein
MSKPKSLAFLAAMRCAVFLPLIGFALAPVAPEAAAANGGPTRL